MERGIKEREYDIKERVLYTWSPSGKYEQPPKGKKKTIHMCFYAEYFKFLNVAKSYRACLNIFRKINFHLGGGEKRRCLCVKNKTAAHFI